MAKRGQLYKFIAVGIANTLLDFGFFNLLVLLAGARGPKILFLNAISITLAAVQSFFLHRWWTFSSQDKAAPQIGRFALSTLAGIVLSGVVVYVVLNLNKQLGLPPFLASNCGKLLGALFSASWNFLWYKHWVFAKSELQPFPQECRRGLVSVIIPAYNEEARLEARLVSLTETLPTLFPTEIIVVDDGSLDETRTTAQIWAEEYPFVRVLGYSNNRGKGEAVRVGMYGARGEYLVFADADNTFTPLHIQTIVEALSSGEQVVIGTRSCGKERLDGESRLRKVLGQTFNILVRLFFLPGIGDSQCGLKGFSRNAAEKLFSKQRLMGFSFDVELLSLARALKLKIKQIPIRAEAEQGSKVNVASAIKMAWELFLLKGNLLLNRYNLVDRKERMQEAALATGIFLVSLAVRLPYLWEVPRFIDELGEVSLAYQIFQGKVKPLHNAAHDIGPLHNYILAGIFKIFGPGIWWPRLYVAITSALTVVLIYFLGKLLFGKKSGLVAAALLAACGMHILVTHMAWSNSTTPFFFAIALYATLVAEKKRTGPWLALTGLLWALALQTHSSVLIYVAVVALYLIFKTQLDKKSLCVAGVAFVLGYSNMIYFNIRSPLGSIIWLSKKGYTLEQHPGLVAFCQNAGKMLLQFLRTLSSSYPELANPLAYLKHPQFTLALLAVLSGAYLAKKEDKLLPLWLIAGGFAAIPWLNSRYSFYLPTRYIMPVVLIGMLLVAKGIVQWGSFLLKNKASRRYAWAVGLAFVALQLVPHYRYCQSLKGTNQANTMALQVLNKVEKASGGRSIFVDRSLPLENNPLPVLLSLRGQPYTQELTVGSMEISPKLAVLSSHSYARLKKTMPLRIVEKISGRVLSNSGEKSRVIYLVEFIDTPGLPVGSK